MVLFTFSRSAIWFGGSFLIFSALLSLVRRFVTRFVADADLAFSLQCGIIVLSLLVLLSEFHDIYCFASYRKRIINGSAIR